MTVDVQHDTLARRRRRYGWEAVLLVALIEIVFVVWTVIAHRVMEEDGANTVVSLSQKALSGSVSVLDAIRARVRSSVLVQARVLSEDPRLKSAMATEGIDRDTLNDILAELHKLSDYDQLALLDPQGAVRAVVGNEEMARGGLPAAEILAETSRSGEAAATTRAAADHLVETAVAPLRFGDNLIGYLVVSEKAIDAEDLAAIHRATGAGIALRLGGTVRLAVPAEDAYRAAFEQFPGRSDMAQRFTAAGRLFLGQEFAVAGIKSSARSSWTIVQPADARGEFPRLGLLLWIPPVLFTVFLCVVPLLRQR
jgi:hypothetical protein